MFPYETVSGNVIEVPIPPCLGMVTFTVTCNSASGDSVTTLFTKSVEVAVDTTVTVGAVCVSVLVSVTVGPVAVVVLVSVLVRVRVIVRVSVVPDPPGTSSSELQPEDGSVEVPPVNFTVVEIVDVQIVPDAEVIVAIPPNATRIIATTTSAGSTLLVAFLFIMRI